jgi:predicted metal-dependent phosphoesterase TrpH
MFNSEIECSDNGQWLLCDFHIHTQFSDGALDLKAVTDFYGIHGFDVICITDHILDSYSIQLYKANGHSTKWLEPSTFNSYLEALQREAARVWEKYGMLVIPGVEITNDSKGFHILAIDIHDYIDPNASAEEVIARIHAQNGIAVASHPLRGELDGTRRLMHLWSHHEKYRPLMDAWEIGNRGDLFNRIGNENLNYIANSDFHDRHHIFSWKTLVKSEKDSASVKRAICKNDQVSIYLLREAKSA